MLLSHCQHNVHTLVIMRTIVSNGINTSPFSKALTLLTSIYLDHIVMRFLESLKSIVFLGAVACAGFTSAHSDDISGLYALVRRRMPCHSDAFTFNLSTTMGSGLDTFTVRSALDSEGDGVSEICIECTTISACARGLYTCVKFQLFIYATYLNMPPAISRSLVVWISGGRGRD